MGSDKFQMGLKTWTNTMNCSIELLADTPKAQAWVIFLLLANQRINQGIPEPTEKERNQEEVTVVRVPIILSMRISEEIFENKVSFTVTWVSQAATFEEVLARAGMFKPVEGTNWGAWTDRVRTSAQNVGGNHQLSSIGNTAYLVDPCNQSGIFNDNLPDTADKAEYYLPVTPLFFIIPPPKESSWLSYDNDYQVEGKASTVTHQKYPESDDDINRGTYDDEEYGDEFKVDSQHRRTRINPYYKQDAGTDEFTVIMRGSALRIGWPTQPPELKDIGGQEALLVDDQSYVSNRLVNSHSGLPVYLTKWHKPYKVLGTPDGNMEVNRTSSGEPGPKA